MFSTDLFPPKNTFPVVTILICKQCYINVTSKQCDRCAFTEQWFYTAPNAAPLLVVYSM